MRTSELARRYAKAVFQLTEKNASVETALNQLRAVSEAIEKAPDLKGFFVSPVIKAEDHEKTFENLFEKKDFLLEVKGLLMVLASNRRLANLGEVVSALQLEVDQSRGVDHGLVKSATTLVPEERAAIEKIISKYTGKKAVMEYQEDKALLGGLVAHVGSFTFDDSLDTQLERMKEDLKNRGAH